jgi:hypothetical protein
MWALKMKVENLRPRATRWTVKLQEKDGKRHAMPCHHALAEVLPAYIDPPASPRSSVPHFRKPDDRLSCRRRRPRARGK